MKSTNPNLEAELIKHRFGAVSTPIQNNGIQLAVPGGVVNIWLGTGTVQVQGTPTTEVTETLNVIAEAVGRKP